MKLRTLDQADLKGKRVILRAGFDVGIEQGNVTDITRIASLVPTMRAILAAHAVLIIIAHEGRPTDVPDSAYSQEPLTAILQRLLSATVHFAHDCVGAVAKNAVDRAKPGEVVLLENLRFHPGEKKNDPVFAKELAEFGDVYVNDAFTNCHRNHASMVALAKLLPAYAGLHLQKEIEHLSGVFEDPRRPLVLIVSGAKMETKVPVIEHFLGWGDEILLGGCVANTFIAARGFDIGSSRHESAYMEKCRELMLEADKGGKADIVIPRDVVVATSPRDAANAIDLPVEDIEGDMAIFDIGVVTTERFMKAIEKAGMVIWNGPLGLYEVDRFARASKRIAENLAARASQGVPVILGGGDTIDFHTRYGLPMDGYTWVSTGGGAMLEFIAGKKFASLEALRIDH